MVQHHVFTFWEPRGELLPYLELCRRTWDRHLAAFEVVGLDHANLETYIGIDTYELDVLKTFPLQVQKDAVMAAVLRRHGGIFVDMDTLVLADLSPLLQALETSEVVLFDSHLAFMVARPQARILHRWVEIVQRRLALGSGDGAAWDALGNSLLPVVMDDVSRRVGAWLRVPPSMVPRRRQLLFRTLYRRYLRSLDRREYGFIAEANHYGQDGGDPFAAYRRFWFDEDLMPDVVLKPGRMIVGLHNSWTPDWYKQLSTREVLEHPCLLSRTLRRLLGR